jgi:S-formylglutathione hydrolase
MVNRNKALARMTLVTVTVMTATAFVTVDAQRRGGGPPGGGGGARRGTIEKVAVHGKALEGNLEGDSPDREVSIYLPPSYASDTSRRFPVIYLLHGFGGRDNTFTEDIGRLLESADRLAGAQGFSEPIVVTPNAMTLHGNSFYSNSPTTGDWEKFIAEDLVGYVDSHYRTLTARMSRGLGGHSAGGYGAVRIALKRPDVFSSLYVMSACCAAPLPAAEILPFATAAEAVKTREQAEESRRTLGPLSFGFALAAAWSPNPSKAPLFVDLPVANGALRQDVFAKWNANATLALIEQGATNLKKYYAVAFDVGSRDQLLASNRQLHEALVRLHVPHYYEEYDGDHMDKIRERLERNVLPFFSTYLVAAANPSSPQVRD